MSINATTQSSHTRYKHILTISLALMLSTSVWATSNPGDQKTNHKTTPTTKTSAKTAKEDNNPTIQISADQLISQTKGGHSEYKGNVQLERNQLSMQGAQLTIIHPNDKLKQATMSGNPAKFKDYLPKKQQWLHGEAKQIIFQQDNDTITLIDNAMMKMDNGNQIYADKIVIHNQDETFEAFGSKTHGRVKMTIQPDN